MGPKMRFPKTISHRGTEVKIYGKKKSYPFYRLVYRVTGKRKMEHFAKYSEAKAAAEKKAEELHSGSVASALTAGQSSDALAAYERLTILQHTIGRRISLLAAVSEFADASAKLKGRNLGEVIDAYQQSIGVVKEMDVSKAVEEFIGQRQLLTESKDGKRAQLSKNYAYMVSLWLREFAGSFPSTSVSGITKEHINVFMATHKDLAAKSRNHYRGAIKMFLKWCVKRDYLQQNHRLLEAESLTVEKADIEDIEFYRPNELQKMLNRCRTNPDYKSLLPVLALGGLAGLRQEEIFRLEWADVWQVADHIEITAQKAKTRSRRLVSICPALTSWLKKYKKSKGLIYDKCRDTLHQTITDLRNELNIPVRRNGFRHAFCTYHFALHANENLTAQQAGNSPAMIHQHYKGLATKAEAEKWFAVMPEKTK